MKIEEAGPLLVRYDRLMYLTAFGGRGSLLGDAKRFELVCQYGEKWYEDEDVRRKLQETCDAIERHLVKTGQLATIKRYTNTGDKI